ncbi:MAG: hypothetical protein UW78_C0006G0105 [Candidatus Azambacteria bacterium GW2011_GWA1_44_9]|uniref:Uncharacterized protein n=1 Tax=Candidatus Azambacteria bacterium GW2011_GWA1_44_9 TaxID=1618610 RepID=A0A0G1KDW0_9BACT|nr:MAG: hypothetical protein UW78_C0006G0105 [Candidatus Azambacteria bacterium GW2011_GWA1_44_9]
MKNEGVDDYTKKYPLRSIFYGVLFLYFFVHGVLLAPLAKLFKFYLSGDELLVFA